MALSESELNFRLLPKRGSWLEPDFNLGWKAIHAAAESFRALVVGFDNACANVEADKDLTPSAVKRRRAEIAGKALSEWKNNRLLKAANDAAERSIKTIEDHMTSIPKPLPDSVAAEIRQHIRSVKSPEDFIKQALKRNDPVTLAAFFHSPTPYLVGLSDEGWSALRQQTILALHPNELDNVRRLRTAMAELAEGHQVVKRIILERGAVEIDSLTGEVRSVHTSQPTAIVVGRSSQTTLGA